MKIVRHRFRGFVLIYLLGVKVVQQVVRVTVAVSAHHHQGNKGGQENGGQHPDGHNHHRLHGDSDSHSSRGKESNQGRLIVRARLWMGAYLLRRE